MNPTCVDRVNPEVITVTYESGKADS